MLGLVDPEYFSYGDAEAARKAMAPVAAYLGVSVEELAAQIMERSYRKIEPIILELAEKYKVETEQISLVGVGGGAAALIVYFAKKMGVQYSIPENAEVISSIGVALAMVRDVVERIIPNPSANDIRNIKLEAINKAIESGATPDSVDVHIEIDSQTSKVTAIALGSTEVKTGDLMSECSEKEAREIAAKDFGEQVKDIKLLTANEHFYVYSGVKENKNPIRILDKKGFIKVQRTDGDAVTVKVKEYQDAVRNYYENIATYNADSILRPDYYICVGGKVVDFNGTNDLDQILMLMDIEVSILDEEDEILLVGARNQL